MASCVTKASPCWALVSLSEKSLACPGHGASEPGRGGSSELSGHSGLRRLHEGRFLGRQSSVSTRHLAKVCGTYGGGLVRLKVATKSCKSEFAGSIEESLLGQLPTKSSVSWLLFSSPGEGLTTPTFPLRARITLNFQVPPAPRRVHSSSLALSPCPRTSPSAYSNFWSPESLLWFPTSG